MYKFTVEEGNALSWRLCFTCPPANSKARWFVA